MTAPVIDSREVRDLVQQLKKIYPFYTPEWRFNPDDPDPGTALFLIFAEMFKENIKRLNRVPDKNFIAFLNLLDLKVLPSRPASAYLCFRASAGTPEPVYVPQGTQVAASGSEGPVIFETERDLLLTPAALRAAFNVNGEKDLIWEVPPEFLEDIKNSRRPGFALYDFPQENLQEHCLYIGHNDLFNIKETALLQIELLNSLKQFKEQAICEKLANPRYVEWSFGREDDWTAFDNISSWGNTLRLEKSSRGLIASREVNGLLNRWVRCRLKGQLTEEMADIDFTGLKLKVRYLDAEGWGGVSPDRAFYNDIEIDPAGGYPFGEFFSLYDTFYLGCQEAFSKKGACISISFKLQHISRMMNNDNTAAIEWKLIMKKSDLEQPERPRTFILKVGWEYWNGKGWVKLACPEGEEIFLHPAERKKTMKFECPEDIAATMVGDQENYWIRARLLSIHNMYAPDAIYQAPWIENVRLQYEYLGPGVAAEKSLSFNNLEYRDGTDETGLKDSLVWPFYSIDVKQPAFYMGFDLPPCQGPINLFFSIKPPKNNDPDMALVEWEYLRSRGTGSEWVKLDVIDGTRAFSQSGLATFLGPDDFCPGSILGRKMYWLRAVNRDGKYDGEKGGLPRPLVKGIYLNTVKAWQQESISAEMLETGSGDLKPEYRLAAAPVWSEELWVDESGNLTEQDKQDLYNKNHLAVREVKDEWGATREFWVRWNAVEDFLASGPYDRHYTVDRSLGKISFGDGNNGRKPPLKSGLDTIRADYRTGGGERGNLGPFEITQLRNSLAFIGEVFNPLPSTGGCDRESFAEAVKRGPQLIKHRNRAVTAGDFEALARQASQNIAQVKCLPNTDGQGRKASACVTLVILPRTGIKAEEDFPVLRQEVEKYLSARTPGLLNMPGKLQVIEPLYLEISVYAVVAVDEMDIAARVEKEARESLNQFLESATDNYRGKGWKIGQYPHISVFYTLLKAINGVNYVENVSMTVFKIDNNERREIDANHLAVIPHGMVVNGSHRVVVKSR